MRTVTSYLFLLGAILGLATCQKNDITPEQKPASTALQTQPTELGTCGEPTTCTLWAGQTINSGTVTVYNDATKLYVHYETTGTFNVLHLWVGTDRTLVPSTPNGTPIPGQFPYQHDVAGGSSYTFEIPLADISFYNNTCGPTSAPIYVIAHAENNVLNGGQETAFGGCIPGEGPRWYYYMSHTVQCCTTPPPPPTSEKLGTAFAKGGYVFTTDPKSNPENLPSLRLTKNRWGWAINMPAAGTATYDLWVGAGLNRTASATKVGRVRVDYTGSNATVTYTLFPGYSIEEAHVYAGDLKPTTIAPGQYGNTYYFNPFGTLATYTYTVTDTDGDGIWVIAHAVAYGPNLNNI